ncbi:MAG: CcmD family protein [Pelobium sp.]
MKKLISLLGIILMSLVTFAQEGQIEMADELRSSGKIYVVVAVLVMLFVAFIIYLFTIDKRVKKIENSK